MARAFRHWSPRYVLNRLLLAYYERRNPDAPWLTRQANELLAKWLAPHHVALEWGSGRSTIWFARRVARLVSVEHDPAWHAQVASRLRDQGLSNVQYVLSPVPAQSESASLRYVEIGNDYQRDGFDFILVDGLHRDRCAAAALNLLKPGGLMVIDNADLYFPSQTNSPGARQRRWTERAELWRHVAESLSTWRSNWTTDGVSDTALFFKPDAA